MHRILRLTVIFGFLLASLVFSVLPAPATPKELRPPQLNNQIKQRTGEVLVKFKSSANTKEQIETIKQIGGKVIEKMGLKPKPISLNLKKQYRKKRDAYVREIRKYKRKKKISSIQKRRLRIWRTKLRKLDSNWQRTRIKLGAITYPVQLIELNRGVSTQQAIDKLKTNKQVLFAEPNYIIRALATRDDTWYGKQWGLNNTGQLIWGYDGITDADIDAPEGWDIEQGSTNPLNVAVIDTGIDTNHPELDSTIWQNTDEVAGNGVDDDSNGYVDDSNGYNWSGISQSAQNAEQGLAKGGTVPDDLCQTIVGTGQQLSSMSFWLKKTSYRPAGHLDINLRTGSCTGPAVLSFRINEYEVDDQDFSDVKKDGDDFPPITLTNGQTYYLEIDPSQSENTYRYYTVGIYQQDPTVGDDAYLDGQLYETTNDGGTWTAAATASDLYFTTNANYYPRDDNKHGTHVSGIISAEGNNSTGVSGLSTGAKIMSLKALDAAGVGSYADLASAIYYAVNNGASIINMSLGGSSNSNTLNTAVQDAYNSGVVMVAAAGNDGNSTTNYPAGFDNVIGVSATNNLDQLAYFSNFNSSVDVSAPGHAIISTISTDYSATSNYGAYDFMSGTSMASPMVAGVAALVRAKYPSYTASQVGLLVTRLSDDLGAVGRDDSFGYGRLNAQKALLDDTSAPSKPVVTSASHVKSASIYSNNDPSFSFTSTDNTEVSGYSFSLTRSSKTTPDAKKDSATTTKSYKNIKNGRWYFHVRATDNFGNWSGAAHYRINVDTYRPVVSAPRSAIVTKGGTVRLYYKIKDYFSGSKKANAVIRIRKGKSVVKTIKLGWVPVNVLRSYLFKANLSPGTYTFSIYATDKTGNTQSKVDSNTLTIKPKPKPKKPKPPGGGEEDAPVNPNPGLPWAP